MAGTFTSTINSPNVRIVNDHGEMGAQYYADPSNAERIAYIKREVATFQRLEPSGGWRLETRGTVAGWHRH